MLAFVSRVFLKGVTLNLVLGFVSRVFLKLLTYCNFFGDFIPCKVLFFVLIPWVKIGFRSYTKMVKVFMKLLKLGFWSFCFFGFCYLVKFWFVFSFCGNLRCSTLGRKGFLVRMMKDTILHQNGLIFCSENSSTKFPFVVCLLVLFELFHVVFWRLCLRFYSKIFHFHFSCALCDSDDFCERFCSIPASFCIELIMIFPALHFDFIRNGFRFVAAIANETDMKYAIEYRSIWFIVRPICE